MVRRDFPGWDVYAPKPITTPGWPKTPAACRRITRKAFTASPATFRPAVPPETAAAADRGVPNVPRQAAFLDPRLVQTPDLHPVSPTRRGCSALYRDIGNALRDIRNACREIGNKVSGFQEQGLGTTGTQ
jgi:hypothetical protein